MTQRARSVDGAPAGAAAELGGLTLQVESMRAVLVRLLQDVVKAEARLDTAQATQLLEANEQLVLTALRAQSGSEPDTTMQAEHSALLQEANEKLILAALNAQDFQAAAERAQQRQVRFIDAVTEELRNPHAPIRIATAMLGRGTRDEPLLPRVQAIVDQQASHMSRMLGELLAMGHENRAPIDLQRRPIDMAGIIDAAARACRHAIDSRSQTLTLHLAAGPLGVDGDASRLTQMLVNLLSNASKYTPDWGAIELSARIAEDKLMLVLTVSDNGIGISEELLPAIFDPFVQDSHAVGFNGTGLGIGLAVVRQIVVAHGGNVVARSAGRGQGSRFVVTLPLTQLPIS